MAWMEAMKPSNICSGFKHSGVYPFNPKAIRPTISTENDNKTAQSSDDNDTGMYIRKHTHMSDSLNTYLLQCCI